MTIDSDVLASLVRRCFERVGLPEPDALTVTEALIDANLRGNASHGVVRVPAYLRRAGSGLNGGSADVIETVSAGPLRRVDGGATLGPVAAATATALCSRIATEHGIGLVALGNGSHFGSAGFYARRIAADGRIGLVATNGPAGMAPHGSSTPFLGTNAFAVGAPLPGRDQFVLDMSCSVAARGKIIRAGELGESIEPGIAVGPDGEPTTDPAAALAGAVLPLGGAKGTGMALAISLAAGALAGASFDDEAGRIHDSKPGPQGLGQLFLAIDPWRLGDRAPTEERIAALIERLHSLPPAAGFDAVLYPGERGERERLRRLDDGVPVAPAELEAIAGACADLELADLAAEARALIDPSTSR